MDNIFTICSESGTSSFFAIPFSSILKSRVSRACSSLISSIKYVTQQIIYIFCCSPIMFSLGGDSSDNLIKLYGGMCGEIYRFILNSENESLQFYMSFSEALYRNYLLINQYLFFYHTKYVFQVVKI